MDKREIIERLKNIAGHAVHTVGEEPFVMSLDDGIAVHEAIELLEKAEANLKPCPFCGDRATIKWKYCWELSEINEAIENYDPEWPGLTSAKQIISIQFEQRQGAYLVVWMYVD